MEFEHPFVFVGFLLLLPILIGLWIISDRIRAGRLDKLGDRDLLISSSYLLAPWQVVLKRALFILGVAMLFIALTGPRKLEKTIKQRNLALDMVIALDCSKSMLAKDFKPNRLERAKMETAALLDSLKGDRVALVAFAGDAFLQCPLTIDYRAVKMFLDAIDTDFLPTPGTDIARAIQVAKTAFPKESSYKVVLLITDGETEDKSHAIAEAQSAAKGHIKIYTIGIGSKEGEPIPMPGGGYKRGPNGEVVLTKLDSDLLRKIAEITGGRYFNAARSSIGIESVFKVISAEKRRYIESGFFPKYKYYYHIPLLMAFVFFLAGWFAPAEVLRR